MKEALSSSETSVLSRTTRRNIPEDAILHEEGVNRFIGRGQFQILTSNLISSKMGINSEVESNKAQLDFTANIPLAYRLSTRDITFAGINNHLPDLNRLLKHKQRLRLCGKKTDFRRAKGQIIGLLKQLDASPVKDT
jgi:hypothetical protein